MALELREKTDVEAGVAIFCHAHKRAEETCLQKKEKKEANVQKER